MRSPLIATTLVMMILSGYSQDESVNEEICMQPANVRLDLRHIEGGGIGYAQGYSTAALFAISENPMMNHWHPFIDLRGHAFNNGRFAANGGVGLRYVNNEFIFGINSYYDYRNKSHFHSNQVGAGIEFLSKRWEGRINGYLPLGKTKSIFYGTALFDRFAGHYMYVKRRRAYTFSGFDGEVAANFGCSHGWNLVTAAGPYYLHGSNESNVYGGKGRLRASYKQYAFLELSGSYDNVFHGQIQGQVGISLPISPLSFWKKKPSSVSFCSTDLQRVSSPYRNEIIPFKVQYKRDSNAVINPATGLPFFFIFVDNTSHSAGTFESPFSDLASAQAASGTNDVIFVFPGDGTTTGLTTTFTMKSGQQLLGTSVGHNLNTGYGTIAVPPMSAIKPHLSATNQLAVMLANDCTVSGLYITSSLSSSFLAAIANLTGFGTPPPVSNPVITDNYIEQTGTAGSNAVRLGNVTGTANISNNTIVSNINSSSATNGISIVNVGTNGSVYVANNSISLTQTANFGSNSAIFINPSSSSTMTAQIINNQCRLTAPSGFVNTIWVRSTSSSITSFIQNNTVTGGAAASNTSSGILVESFTSGTVNSQILSNSVAAAGIASTSSGCIAVVMATPGSTHLIQGNSTSVGGLGIALNDSGSTVGTYSCINNSTNNTAAASIRYSGTGSMCTRYQNNSAASDASTITITRVSGTLNLEPLVGNTGTVSTSGTITNVSQNYCGN